MFLNHNCTVGDTAYDNRRLFVEEAIYRLHLHDVSVDFCITDLCQAGGTDTGIAYLYAILCTTVYLRINIFFQSQFVEHFRPHEPDERPDTGYS